MQFSSVITAHLADHVATTEKLLGFQEFIDDLALRMIGCLKAGGKIIFFGNGGSAADAQHLAAELVVRYRQNRRALAGIALTTDTSILTAGANDFGFETVYARQIEALARPGDMAIGFSTSGESLNIIAGLRAAQEQGCVTVAFTAEGGGTCAQIADVAFRAPSAITARAQECHLLVGHILCELIELDVLGESAL